MVFRKLEDLSEDEKTRIFNHYKNTSVTIEQLAQFHNLRYRTARKLLQLYYRALDRRSRPGAKYYEFKRLEKHYETTEIHHITQKKAQLIYTAFCREVAKKKRSKDKKILTKDPFLTVCKKHELGDLSLHRIIEYYKRKKEYGSKDPLGQITTFRKNLDKDITKEKKKLKNELHSL